MSKVEFSNEQYIDWCMKNDTRHVSVKLKDGTEIHNFYIPAGGDEPDIVINPKFEHKMSFLNEIKNYFLD